MTATQQLQARGLRPTLSRLLILELLIEQTTHADAGRGLSCDALYSRIHARGEHVSLPAIYKALNDLCTTQLVERFRYGTGASVFALRGRQACTVHQLCTRCGACHEFGDEVQREQLLAATSGPGFSATALVVQGLCSSCSTRPALARSASSPIPPN